MHTDNTNSPAPLPLEQIPQAVSAMIGRLDRLEEQIEAAVKEPEKGPEVDEDGEVWFTVPQLCDYLPDHPAKPTVYGWIYEKKIPHYKRSKKLLFKNSEIDPWAQARRIATAEEMEAEAIDYLNAKKLQ